MAESIKLLSNGSSSKDSDQNLNEIKLKFAKLSHEAFAPVKANFDSAGFDLKSPLSLVIMGGERALINTQLALVIPQGAYVRIAPRSSLALQHGIDVLAGVID